ncbi:uncharacterized protein BCR38DRAFT_238425 [Pseudomassariella vexata]|uniref:Uncharacterized protein n=1 Tax=Pseudomassariella vexata TaxID=1141098 RepID=A0A1Y2DT90_9PEZI|nr:uncharacterized protein BCR38DRAFT_238425 [Pseudomassariella vexata]ORY62364.1 hypothetical protein BCR38DRAFT_238425 [Pseudomassariella vexata]
MTNPLVLREKPYVSSNLTAIVLGTVSGLVIVILFSTLIFLHLRRRSRDKREWPKDPQELEDYGIDPSQVKPPQKAYQQSGTNQKPFVPPGGGSSRESLNSLARDIQDNPFGPKAEIISGDSKAAEASQRY